jgi:segregation and condensation protein B
LPTNNIDSKALIEAALFAAGKALSLKDLSRLSGLSEEGVRALAEELARDYSLRGSGIEIRSFENSYGMQVRATLARDIISVAPKEIDAPLIRTLAIIAYKQPLKQSKLAEIRGNKSYSHVKELEQMGLISAKKKGRTKLLTTTKGFAEYFGLVSDTPEFVRGMVLRSSRPLGVTRMYESLATRLGLDYVVVNPYKPEVEDLELLKGLRILVAAPGYAAQIREHYSGELIEAGVRTFSQLKESSEKICRACGQGKIEELAAEIDRLLQDYRLQANNVGAVKPLTPMIEDMARDLRISVQEDGTTAAPDYANLESSIIVPTHQPYEMDVVERIKQRYESLLKGLYGIKSAQGSGN